MTILHVKSTALDSPASTGNVSLTVSSVAGNALFFCAIDYGDGAAGQITAITDSAGNTWTQYDRKQDALPTCGASIWYTLNAAAVSSITVHATAGFVGEMYEFSGVSATDVKHDSTGTSTSVSSGATVAPAGTADLVLCVGGNTQDSIATTYSAAALTTAGGTFIKHNEAAAFTVGGYTGRNILAAATAQTFTMTLSGSDDWVAIVALFSPTILTNIKTVDGLAKASVKTVSGLPIASVKTIEGLA
jgi:hypothetical protein